MLAKAIATGFNSPFVSIPGSGFASTFIGVDAILVRYLARKAKRLARKWGGTCIVFIDEIDAVGMRRQALNPGMGSSAEVVHPKAPMFHGPWGALNPSGDLVLETQAWRDWIFDQRETRAVAPSGLYARLLGVQNFMFPGGAGMGGGSLALNQLLVVMDGIDNPPFMRRVLTSKFNTVLDASYIVPRRLGKVPLRLPAPRPRGDQIYFIGATNVPMNRLDPALLRPGRMGRHVWFRTPTVDDRKDIFDLYMDKVTHDPELDTPDRRDEIARITGGYSPAMIDQVCSMALTLAHHDLRDRFSGTTSSRRSRRSSRGPRSRSTTSPPRRARPRSTRPATPSPHTCTPRTSSRPASRSDAAAARAATTRRARSRSGCSASAPRRWPSSSGASARWRPSTSSTARTRTASAATSSRRRGRRRRWSARPRCRPSPST